jgi:glucose-1-phosphate thymidylyltransferase
MSKSPRSRDAGFIALIPAAGIASRLPGVTGSKEMLPVPARDSSSHAATTEPVICHLLRSLRLAGVAETRIVLRAGKWDIPDHLSHHDWYDLNLNFILTRGTSGVPETVATGLRDRPGNNVIFGFPDILFEPMDAMEKLARRLQDSEADVILGVFPTGNPAKMDMVMIDQDDRVLTIEIKPERTSLSYTWITAAWTPTFTDYFLGLQQNAPTRVREQAAADGDLHLGHLLQLALDDGLRVEAEVFTNGRSLDIGTPDDLDAARNWLDRD